ncbi:MAG TPA: DNA recombination protein RmuC [Candidatus Saccharimonadales bacterium]|nr:DNA recombination protein RmuC [Candidatus Saccharimonadales bacterium]
MTGVVIGLGVLCAVLIALITVLLTRRSSGSRSVGALLIKEDLGQLSEDITKLKDSLQLQLNERFDKNHELMRQSMVRQFSESAKLITDVTQRLAKLDETNRRVVDVADELKILQNVLQNPKQRGVLGEYYLAQVLENVLPPEGFKLQYHFKRVDEQTGKELIADAVILLDKGKLLPVDSKFSLENYNRLLEEKDKQAREQLAKTFRADLKQRIDETAKYIQPSQGTMDYAFMFIPSEAIYYDLLVNKVGASSTSARDLLEYAFREKGVIIVSPTTFMAYLQTVLQGLRGLQIEEQAKQIQKRVGELGKHIETYEQFMQKLGSSLGTTVGHFNNAHKELKKVDKDVLRLSNNTESVVEPLVIDRPLLED